jgi:hypothetical protein
MVVNRSPHLYLGSNGSINILTVIGSNGTNNILTNLGSSFIINILMVLIISGSNSILGYLGNNGIINIPTAIGNNGIKCFLIERSNILESKCRGDFSPLF